MKTMISLKQALRLTQASLSLMEEEKLPLNQLTGRILSADLISQVNSPSVNASLKDGYAVISQDVERAGQENPVALMVSGKTSAGDTKAYEVNSGHAVRVTTGAPVPKGATAVIAEEFCQRDGNALICLNTAPTGINIISKGSDIRHKQVIAKKGELLTPALVGLMASAGIAEAKVYQNPLVAVIATGDEVVAPGRPLPEGKLYASNMVEICSWLSLFGLPYHTRTVNDSKAAIRKAIKSLLPRADAFITTGGAWGSEKDLILKILEELGWQGIYHRIRMGPGKGVGYGLLNNKPFFCLPGGPPSCEMAFLQLAIPSLFIMSGRRELPFPIVKAKLKTMVNGDIDWTQFIHACIEQSREGLLVKPLLPKSRLQSMAQKDALIKIPEGVDRIEAGEWIEVQLLTPGKTFNYIY